MQDNVADIKNSDPRISSCKDWLKYFKILGDKINKKSNIIKEEITGLEPVKLDPKEFYVPYNVFRRWSGSETSSLDCRWRRVLNTLEKNGCRKVRWSNNQYISMTREQILYMNAWNDVERYIDKSARYYQKENKVILNRWDGLVKFLKGFEDYFSEGMV